MKPMPVIALLMLIAGCAINTTQDYDTSFDFSRLRSYSWQAPTQRGTQNNTLIDDRVRRAVDVELSEKGYQRTDDPARADFYVTYHYAIQDYRERDRYAGPSVGVGVGSGSRGTFGGIGIGIPIGSERTYEQDTLTIDVVDPKSGKLVWRGVAKQEYRSKLDPKELTERFNETVGAILAKFPPK